MRALRRAGLDDMVSYMAKRVNGELLSPDPPYIIKTGEDRLIFVDVGYTNNAMRKTPYSDEWDARITTSFKLPAAQAAFERHIPEHTILRLRDVPEWMYNTRRRLKTAFDAVDSVYARRQEKAA
jgi:hypothetical protein